MTCCPLRYTVGFSKPWRGENCNLNDDWSLESTRATVFSPLVGRQSTIRNWAYPVVSFNEWESEELIRSDLGWTNWISFSLNTTNEGQIQRELLEAYRRQPPWYSSRFAKTLLRRTKVSRMNRNQSTYKIARSVGWFESNRSQDRVACFRGDFRDESQCQPIQNGDHIQRFKESTRFLNLGSTIHCESQNSE